MSPLLPASELKKRLNATSICPAAGEAGGHVLEEEAVVAFTPPQGLLCLPALVDVVPLTQGSFHDPRHIGKYRRRFDQVVEGASPDCLNCLRFVPMAGHDQDGNGYALPIRGE